MVSAIRRMALASGLVACLLLVAASHPSSAALSLALPSSDYPPGSRVVVLPATNQEADTYLRPVHRSNFEKLGRIDGDGWIQAGLWHFSTGRGKAAHRHRTVFAYAINVYRGDHQARHAFGDVKLKGRPYRTGHHRCYLYQVANARRSLTFLHFVLGTEDVESYLEYQGVAPRTTQHMLRRFFNRTSAQLVSRTRELDHLRRLPPATATVIPNASPAGSPSPSATATALPSATSSPTATSTPTVTPVRTPTSTPTATATAEPAVEAQASMQQAVYHSGDVAGVVVTVTSHGRPVVGAYVTTQFVFPNKVETCTATTDAAGEARCDAPIPTEPNGTQVSVDVQIQSSAGNTTASTSFTVSGS
ncbi:MAG: hypothetical protein ACRDFS_04725 [Chloroflexota bacterium]